MSMEQRKVGRKMIEQELREIAANKGVELTGMSWSPVPGEDDEALVPEGYNLVLSARHQTDSTRHEIVSLTLAREGIEDYPGRVGTEGVDNALRDAVRVLSGST